MMSMTNAVSLQKREKLGLPKYTIGEEVLNCLTHAAGAGLSIAGLVLMIVKSSSGIGLLCSLFFGITLILLYTNSAVYHGAKVNKAKKVFRVIDHCTIFLLIAGTYTPYTLMSLKGTTGYIIFCAIWLLAIAGIVLNIIDLKKFSKFSMVLYILMGWCIVAAGGKVLENIGTGGIVLLLVGGIAYTIGAVLYGLGKKIPYMHSIWHIFVLAGSILHFFSVYFYVI